MKCLILGDLHLGKGVSIGRPAEFGNLNSRIQDQIDLLDWSLNLCSTEGAKHIVLTGDVYQDYRPHPAVISIFMQWLKRCKAKGVEVHVIMGNHDILRSGNYIVTALDLVDDTHLELATVHKTFDRLELDDFTIVLVPFRDKRMYEVKTKEEAALALEKELGKACKEDSNKTKVAIGHLALEGSLSIGDEISDQLNELYVSPEMFSWFDFVWMGHIHHPQVIQNQKPYAAHVGSLDRSDFSKTEIEHDKIAIMLDSDHKNKFREIPLPVRDLRPIKIEVPSGKDSTEFVVNELCLLSKTTRFKGSIVRLDITLNGAELENVQRDKVEDYLYNNLETHHLCGFSESRSISTIQINPEDAFDNTMEVTQSINKWAETRDHFEDEHERAAFKAAAHDTFKEYEEKYLK